MNVKLENRKAIVSFTSIEWDILVQCRKKTGLTIEEAVEAKLDSLLKEILYGRDELLQTGD